MYALDVLNKSLINNYTLLHENNLKNRNKTNRPT